MVGDLRDLNRIKIKNQACLRNIEDLFEAFQGITYFTMPHLRSGYNQIRIEEAATTSNDHRYSIWSFPIHLSCTANLQTVSSAYQMFSVSVIASTVKCISQDPEKIKPVSNFDVPMSTINVRQFLGFAIGRTNWKTCAFRAEQVSTASILDLETGAAGRTGVKIGKRQPRFQSRDRCK